MANQGEHEQGNEIAKGYKPGIGICDDPRRCDGRGDGDGPNDTVIHASPQESVDKEYDGKQIGADVLNQSTDKKKQAKDRVGDIRQKCHFKTYRGGFF